MQYRYIEVNNLKSTIGFAHEFSASANGLKVSIMSNIAFIGLGDMGAPMAANLIKTGHKVMGFDMSSARAQQALARGIPMAKDPKSAVESAEIIITMMPTAKHVRMVWSSLIAIVPEGTLFIDCSTIDVETSRAVHEIAREKGMMSLDAPVSGGTGGAQTASLTFMVGGDIPAFNRARALFDRMGKKTLLCGGAGAGQAAKICNNMMLGISMIGVCEVFALSEKLGLTNKTMFDVLSSSTGQCWAATTYCPVPGLVPSSPANNGYKQGFSASHMLKDLRLATEVALQTQSSTPLGTAAAQMYKLFENSGNGDLDFSAIIKMIRGDQDKGEAQS